MSARIANATRQPLLYPTPLLVRQFVAAHDFTSLPIEIDPSHAFGLPDFQNFRQDECQRYLVHRKSPPRRAPCLMEMTKLVGQLEGYVIRKKAGPPGPQTIWIGLQRMYDIATCWLTFGPGAKHKTCV
jgi:hypothetical protein